MKSVWCLKRKIIKLCSALGVTLRAWFYRTDPPKYWRTIRNTLGLFEKHFSKANEKKSPEIYFGPKSFRTIFEKRTPVYSLAATLLGLAKAIYYSLLQWCYQSKPECVQSTPYCKKLLKWYYDQKITFIFSSDFVTMFVKHSPSEIISLNFEKKTVNLNFPFPF